MVKMFKLKFGQKGWLAIAKLKPLSLSFLYSNIVKCFLKH